MLQRTYAASNWNYVKIDNIVAIIDAVR